jgi:transcriptional regulator with XRE-family HTH domain
MYEIFEKLCIKFGITPYKFCKDNNVRTSTVSTWKKKNSLVGPELATKICDYFGISMDYLMTGVDSGERKSELTPVSERDIAKKINEIIGDMNDKDSSPLYFNGEKIDDKSLAILEQALISAMKQVEIMRDKGKNK